MHNLKKIKTFLYSSWETKKGKDTENQFCKMSFKTETSR